MSWDLESSDYVLQQAIGALQSDGQTGIGITRGKDLARRRTNKSYSTGHAMTIESLTFCVAYNNGLLKDPFRYHVQYCTNE